ncbi:MAG: hypothetical protein JST47_02665 [Bacteroidetes bacterium]|nr:hypothetical protein [Bacteroidota bacterium]MBS1972934.1 hypothetical protein [Bacteroidota bacterium]
MEDIELKNIWKEYDRKINEAKLLNMQSWALAFRTFEYMQAAKAKSKLNALRGLKKWMVFAGILWIAFLLFLILNSLSFSNVFFLSSLSAIVVFNVIAVAAYVRHVVLINEIDNSESLIEAQQKMAKLQSSTLQIARILFLQAPFYTTFFWSQKMIAGNWAAFLLVSLPVTLFFILLSVWLYQNIKLTNADKKWFKILFSSREWTSVIKAIQFMNEIEAFKKESL